MPDAIAVGRNNQYRRIGKVVERLRRTQGWTSKNEKKWATIGSGAKETFCQLAAEELAGNPGASVFVAVYHKTNAPDFLRTINVRELHSKANEAELQVMEAKYRGRAHLVYSMMVAETLAEYLPELDKFTYCPDELNEGQRTLDHILTYRLLFQQGRSLVLNPVNRKDPMQPGLDFADMCAGAVFEAFQFGDDRYLDILKPYIKIKLFPAESDTALVSSDAPGEVESVDLELTESL